MNAEVSNYRVGQKVSCCSVIGSPNVKYSIIL